MKIEGSGSASGSISQKQGSADPDPHQNVMENDMKFGRIFGSGSALSLNGWIGIWTQEDKKNTKIETTKLILLDSLLQEVEDFAPTLCFR